MQPWQEVAHAAPIDEGVSKLVTALKAYHGVGVGSNLFNQALFPDGFVALLSRLSGEHTEFGRGCVCWLDSVDHVDHLRWRELCEAIAASTDKAKAAVLEAARAVEFPFYEGKRAEAAATLVALLRVLAVTTDYAAIATLASLGSDVMHGPSFGAPSTNPLPLRGLLLPPSTRRLLAAAEWTDPTVVYFDGGLTADALLPVLRARHREAYRQPLLLPPGSSQAAVAAATADHTSVRVAPRDALMCHLMNWLTSKTRRRDVTKLGSQMHFGALPFRPLAYTTVSPRGSLVCDRPFLVWLWETIDACTPSVKGVMGKDTGGSSASGSIALASDLADSLFPPPGVPDAELFLAAACAYWLGENHPYAVEPLPGQAAVPAAPAQQAGNGRARAVPASSAGAAAEVRTTIGPKSEKKAPPQWRSLGSGDTGSAAGSASAWAASLASVFGSPAPVAAYPLALADPLSTASTYSPTSIDVVEAVMLLWTLQLTDVSVVGVMSGRELSSAREQPAGGGPSLLRLAGEAANRSHGVSLEGGAGDVANVVRQLSSSDAGRKLLVDTGGRVGAGVVPIPAGLRDIVTGPTRMPEVLGRLYAPMFHWLRVHLSRAEVKGDALEFGAVVDAWLTVLTPWRARPRYKGANADLRGLRAARFFDYAASAERALRVRAEEKRRAGRPGRGELTVVDASMGELAREARSSAAYTAVLAATGDFSGGRLAASTALASLPPDHTTLESWAPYVRLFAPFYTHLLAVFLRRMRTADFTQDAWLRVVPPPAVAADIAAGGSGPTPPRGPLLLELLERVLDVYEPGVIAILREAEAEANGLFPREPIRGRSGSDAFATNALTGSHGGGKAHPPARMAARVQLLAGVQMLSLPPEVLPSAVLPTLPSLTEKADLVARRLQAALDGPSLGPSPITGADGAGSSTLHFVRMPEVAVPEGACVNGVRNLAYWDGVVAGVCEAAAFLFSPFALVLGLLLDLAGQPALLAAFFEICRAAVVAIVGVMEAAASVVGRAGERATAASGSPLPACFRMGDRLQLAQDRLLLAFGRDATASALPAPTALRLRARAPTSAEALTSFLRSALAWCLLRPLSQAAVPSRSDRPYGAWESAPLIAATDVASSALREAGLFLAALVLAGIARANPGRPAPALSVASLPAALRGNVLRVLGMADVRVLPLWVLWLLLLRVVGVWYALLAACVGFGALRAAI
jgi:hypothetical protein